MKDKFKDLRIVDNFYQTSAFFPMPLTLIGTLDENGKTSYGAYSLIFPYYIAGKDYYAMVLGRTVFNRQLDVARDADRRDRLRFARRR